jgi:hypothetical protein
MSRTGLDTEQVVLGSHRVGLLPHDQKISGSIGVTDASLDWTEE